MKTMLSVWIVVLLTGATLADGIRMTRDYRFVDQPETCYAMTLTAGQIAALEAKRKGKQKLYADLTLTKEQVTFLKKKTGKDITKVLVFEKGWNDCGCCAQNIASRFKPDQIEVSDVYLADEGELRRWEEGMKALEKQQALDAEKAAEKKLKP